MTLPRFVLVTGNRDKVAEARRVWPGEIEHVALDLPEIQSLDLDAVLQAKAEEAWRRLERPLVVEETGLELAALSGFPGPLVKWMLESVGATGIARTALALGDPRATARCRLLYFDGRARTVAEGSTRGVLLAEPRGTGGFGWDPVFLPDGENQTYGELTPARKDAIGHRGQAWRALHQALR
jgi:non-canonical purine NTP pyrophosphatase (RdgB/HAM1 family)